ncbi:NAD-dependent malic enzyme [Methylococcus capsulatus]|uniref:NAD-dependent malic enzyme n=1 Tax=Methylococcus capsulatus TaxID=414 RepID=UPI0001A230F3|nr:NAD-dependent malic enzyme [Methylococcus capsulatus]
MIDFKITRDPQTGGEIWTVPLRGPLLLNYPLFNKGPAFPEQERRELGLLGLLPPHVDTLETQVERAYEAFRAKPTDLERHIYLRALQDENEVLFYRLMQDYIGETMPVVYTPTVGEACQRFSHIYRHPRGLFIAYPEREHIDELLANTAQREVDVIVVTDGERILGLGDQGAGGMGIPIGKLALYTLCGGIHPARTLPVLLDVGTDNPDLLNDPLYMGWRHPRVRGTEYDEFVERFVQAVMRRYPNVLLQWEDFAQANAGPLLERYRDRLCTFNDDIQGTAAVATGTVLAAVKVTGTRLRDQVVAVFGAGSAGCGIAEQICAAMVRDGLSETEARSRCFLIDRSGLLREGLSGLPPFQQAFAQPAARLAGWRVDRAGTIGLAEVVNNARPSVLIGVSGAAGAFTESIVKAMADYTPRPIILPLSNPTSRCEALPAQILAWTEGRALVATGSPFADVAWEGRTIPIPQCNNSYIFPGLGLGILAIGARRVTPGMFMAAAQALANASPAATDPHGPLLPPLTAIRNVSRLIALAVAKEAVAAGVAAPASDADLERMVDERMWTPAYARLTGC